MKRRMWIGLLLTLVLCGCSGEAEVVNTFTETPEELITERIEQGEEVTMQTYYELSDGT